MNTNGYFQTPCRKRVSTRQVDLEGNDFNINVVAEPGEEEGFFDITATLSPKSIFGDVGEIVTAGNATLFDSPASESAAGTDAGPNTDGTPASLELFFEGVEQTEANVSSSWKLVVANVQVVAKDGQTFTIPVLTKTFPSPL